MRSSALPESAFRKLHDEPAECGWKFQALVSIESQTIAPEGGCKESQMKHDQRGGFVDCAVGRKQLFLQRYMHHLPHCLHCAPPHTPAPTAAPPPFLLLLLLPPTPSNTCSSSPLGQLWEVSDVGTCNAATPPAELHQNYTAFWFISHVFSAVDDGGLGCNFLRTFS